MPSSGKRFACIRIKTQVMWTYGGYNRMAEGAPKMNAMSMCVNVAVSEGYKECFKVTARGLYAVSNSRYYRPEQVQIAAINCFDKNINPADNSTIYLLETSDGCKGTLVDAYGQHHDEFLLRFISQVEDIRNKLSRHERPSA